MKQTKPLFCTSLLIFLISTASFGQLKKLTDPANIFMVSKILEYDSSGLIYWKCDSINPDDVATIFKSSSGLGTYDTLILTDSREDSILHMVKNRFTQFHKGIVVEYGGYVEHVYNGSLLVSNGSIVEGLNDRDTSPSVSESAALATALAALESDSFYWEDDTIEYYLKLDSIDGDTTWYPKGELMFINIDSPYYSTSPFQWKLAWRFYIRSLVPNIPYIVCVDALNGDLLKIDIASSHSTFDNPIYGNNLYIDTRLHNGKHYLWANDGGKTIKTRRADYGNRWRINDLRSRDDPSFGTNYYKETQTHFVVNMAYTYWDTKFGISGMDGFNKELRVTIYDFDDPRYNAMQGTQYIEPRWTNSPEELIFGAFDNAALDAVQDVAGHEYAHGVVKHASSLGNCGETGSVGEGLSDIFGTTTEAFLKGGTYNWTIGEDGVWTIRNLQTPSNDGNPREYKGSLWRNTDSACSCRFRNISQNLCYSHTNSGVVGRWFYLLTDGGANTGFGCSPVTGIGLLKAEAIAQLAATKFIIYKTNIAGLRAATICAAKFLFGDCSNELVQVCRAWANCNVGPCCECVGEATKPLNCWPDLLPVGAPNTYGINDLHFEMVWGIYPNPVANNLNLTYNSDTDIPKEVEYTIFNMQGVRIVQNALILKENDLIIDTKELVAGAYVLVMRTTNGYFKLKFIKN